MNIFVLDRDPVQAAMSLCDKHVPKMILETAQLLCSAFDNAPYKRTHYNHPCAKWVRESKANFVWLAVHGEAMHDEYVARFNKTHKSFAVIQWCLHRMETLQFSHNEPTDFVLCMPDQYKVGDVVESYRQYYRLGKTFAKWDKLGNRPDWMTV